MSIESCRKCGTLMMGGRTQCWCEKFLVVQADDADDDSAFSTVYAHGAESAVEKYVEEGDDEGHLVNSSEDYIVKDEDGVMTKWEVRGEVQIHYYAESMPLLKGDII